MAKTKKTKPKATKPHCVYDEIDDLPQEFPNISDDTKAILRALTVIAVELNELNVGVDLLTKAVQGEEE